MKVKVRFSVTYETVIEVEEGEDVAETFQGMDLIPETPACTYFPNSCHPNTFIGDDGVIYACEPEVCES